MKVNGLVEIDCICEIMFWFVVNCVVWKMCLDVIGYWINCFWEVINVEVV